MPHIQINDEISLFYQELGSGENYILSAQVGFSPVGMHQKLAEIGYHIFCITLRGFHPSTLIAEDYGENWYDVFADDVIAFAEKMNIKDFVYMGASHGAGVGWHLLLRNQQRVKAFIAVVPGPHSLKEGTMSYRQMLEQGIIKCPPPFDPEIDNDNARQKRRDNRNDWLAHLPEAPALEKAVDYGRPLMRMKTEENLCNELKKIQTPTLILGGVNDPISTPELMIRTANCLPHCKLIIYSNCGHNLDTDLIEETCDETHRFLQNTLRTGKVYLPVEEK